MEQVPVIWRQEMHRSCPQRNRTWSTCSNGESQSWYIVITQQHYRPQLRYNLQLQLISILSSSFPYFSTYLLFSCSGVNISLLHSYLLIIGDLFGSLQCGETVHYLVISPRGSQIGVRYKINVFPTMAWVPSCKKKNLQSSGFVHLFWSNGQISPFTYLSSSSWLPHSLSSTHYPPTTPQ
jgi:hypothetical protein